MPEISVEEALRQNCDAIMTGDLLRVMADFTPDALAALLATGAGFTGDMPMLHGYSIDAHEEQGTDHIFRVRFTTSAGDVTANATWRDVEGGWKIVALSLDGLSGLPAG